MTDTNEELAALKAELARMKDINNHLVDELEEREEESKRLKNLNFVQLYKKQLIQLRALTDADPNALRILLVMVEKMNKQNALIISQKNLEKIIGKKRTTIHNAIKVLKEQKFLDIIKVGVSNAYVVNANVFWQDNAKLKDKIAVFTATVIASGDEQDEKYFEDWKGIKLKNVPMLNDEIPIEVEEAKNIKNDIKGDE